MGTLDGRLLNEFQRDFPLMPRPFAGIAARLDATEDAVIGTLVRLAASGKVSRVGATFAPGRIGAATLAALSVPQGRLQQVAELVSACPEVNHNYEREHHYNLWFVVTGPDERRVDSAVRDIERAARCGRVLSLPLVEPYHVDLGFDISSAVASRRSSGRDAEYAPLPSVALAPAELNLVAALQEGLPLVATPYAALAQRARMTEATVIATLRHWLESRIINRLGVIVRHHELGYHANAMVVWDVPNDEVRAVGQRVATAPCVTLCYRRRRHLPHWHYNLYCMIHGKDRDQVLAQIAELREHRNLAQYPSQVLFSRRRFKQRGARYLPAVAAAVSHG